MTCREMEEVIITSAVAPEATEHVAECKHCRHLVTLFGESGQASPPSTDQMKRIEAMILRGLTPVQPLASQRAFFSAFALVFLAVVGGGSLLLGTDGWRALSVLQRIARLCADGSVRGAAGPLPGSADGPGKRTRHLLYSVVDRSFGAAGADYRHRIPFARGIRFCFSRPHVPGNRVDLCRSRSSLVLVTPAARRYSVSWLDGHDGRLLSRACGLDGARSPLSQPESVSHSGVALGCGSAGDAGRSGARPPVEPHITFLAPVRINQWKLFYER